MTLDEHVAAAFSAYRAAGAAFMAEEWPRIAPDLSTLISKDVIDGERTMHGWFASVDANVFISHSHADKGLAIGLAGFLRQELGLRPFVDSLVWGNSSELLWEFDNLHCKHAGATTFDYERRNYSTSHVHMMLAASLSEAIDNCECIVFLNTPSSIQVSDAKERAKEMTASPWIYHELNTSRLIRQRQPDRSALQTRTATEAYAPDEASCPVIRYSAPLEHLTALHGIDVLMWNQFASNRGVYGPSALDILYRSHPPSRA